MSFLTVLNREQDMLEEIERLTVTLNDTEGRLEREKDISVLYYNGAKEHHANLKRIQNSQVGHI